MNYSEIKTAQTLHQDRIELLNFVHAVLAFGVNTNQKALVTMGHRTLDRLQNKTMFIQPNQGVHYSL